MIEVVPVGLDSIIHTFGSLDDPNFEARNIVTFNLPYSLFYNDAEVKRARAHKLAVDNFIQGFKNVADAGLADQFKEFNGIYARRAIRGQASHPSTHSWGIAVDMGVSHFPLGSLKRMPDGIIKAMQAAGFFYGGDFKSRKDPMHFQLARGY